MQFTPAHELLAAYSRHTGIADLKFSPDGCARLLFEGAVAIDIEIDPSSEQI